MSAHLKLIPRRTEKTFASAQKGVYVFTVPTTANKNDITAAVAEQFEVTVTDVRVVNVKGKVKQQFRKNGRSVKGKRSDTKKAYVTLAEGDSIKIFEEEQ